MRDIVIYARIVLYSVSAIILILFAYVHRDRSRRLRNLSLAIFFLTVVASLVARIFSGSPAQNAINDWLTTPALMFYVISLAIDFYLASINGRRNEAKHSTGRREGDRE